MLAVEYEKQSEALLKVISRSGMSSILRSLEKNPQRFSQLMFKAKLNPGILDRHLKSLMEIEAVEKEGDIYVLTDKGHRLIKILYSLFEIYMD
jgi:DNA-binding HxlR family transcriptional regulator